MSNDQPADPMAWLQGLQKTQSEWLRQWLPWSLPVGPAATSQAPAAQAGGALAARAADLTRRVLAQVEQSLGVSRAIWDLLGRSAALADTGQRMAAFNAGVQQLQSEFAKLFAPAAAFATAGRPGAWRLGHSRGVPQRRASPACRRIPWASACHLPACRESDRRANSRNRWNAWARWLRG